MASTIRASVEPGTLIGGKYRIVQLLGVRLLVDEPPTRTELDVAAEEILKSVYGLIAKRDLASSVAAWQIAKPVAAEAEGAVQLALYEAIADSLSALLTEIAEHGAQNRALWGIAPSDVDARAFNEECEQAWAAITRLRAQGLSSGPLIEPYVGSWMAPIGSRDWLNQMRLGVRHRQQPDWLDRVARLARG